MVNPNTYFILIIFSKFTTNKKIIENVLEILFDKIYSKISEKGLLCNILGFYKKES